MIAVLASRLDSEATSLVTDWASMGAALMSAEDLIQPGWIFDPCGRGGGSAVVSGMRVPVSEVRAVLTRRPAVLAVELNQIKATDREYVAAEANAFLVAWLSTLACPVVNAPTPRSLCGPAWDVLHWRSAVAKAGARWADTEDEAEPHEVVVCGSECLFAESASQARISMALAREANVELLGVWFRGGKVSGATVAPRLADAEVRACLLAHLADSS